MDDITSIQVSKTSKDKWTTFKNHPNESYENMFNRILNQFKEDDDDLLTSQDLIDIEKSLIQIKNGEYTTLDDILKERGL